jgi:hypothetical protein
MGSKCNFLFSSQILPQRRISQLGLCRWAWNQLEKDDEGLVKLGARTQVFSVLSEFNNHVLTNGAITDLIKECRSRNRPGLVDDDMQDILQVIPPKTYILP